MRIVARGMLAATALTLLTLPAAADLAANLSGKTLVAGESSIVMGADGKLTGKVGKGGKDVLAGTWSVEGGKLCRTITQPKRLAGSECQTAVLKRNKLTITRADGSATEWAVE